MAGKALTRALSATHTTFWQIVARNSRGNIQTLSPWLASPASCPYPYLSYLGPRIGSKAFQSTDAPKNASENPEESGASEEVSEIEKKLTEENQVLQEKLDDLMDKYRRSIAESDNMRKRLTKQIDDAKIFGIQGFCKDLLEVADVLSLAIAGISPEALEKESQYLKDMHQGLKLTDSQLLQVFKRHGLEKDDPKGEKFDPNKHEALFQIPNPECDHNTVLDVQKVGYLLHGRTIRPAKVGVSKKA